MLSAQDNPKARFAFFAFAFLVFYSGFTTILSAFELRNTIDENIYIKAGLDYLNTLSFDFNHEHPPFSKWFGALIPWVFDIETLPWFRLAHIILYLAGGIWISFAVGRRLSPLAVLFCGLVYFTDPNLKAMAALHINDFDVALFVAASALSAFLYFKKQTTSLFFAAIFFFMLAINSKFTGLFYAPFLFLGFYLFFRGLEFSSRTKWLKNSIFVFLAALIFAFLISYLFQVDEVHWYGKGIDAQRLHNRAQTHPAFLNGEISFQGFPLFYILSLWAKMPLAHLLLWGTAMVLFLCRITTENKRLFFFTALPAFLLLLHLSFLNVQTGLRYYLPGVLLLHLFTTYIILETLKNSQKHLRLLVIVFALASLIPDAFTIHRHSYLSYFNFWIHNPTRMFADSNSDWRQGLPARVRARLPSHTEWSALRPGLFEREQVRELFVLVGAMDLSGLSSLRAPLLSAFHPEQTIGAYELHRISKAHALRLFAYPVSTAQEAFVKSNEFKVWAENCATYPIDIKDGKINDTCPIKPGESS